MVKHGINLQVFIPPIEISLTGVNKAQLQCLSGSLEKLLEMIQEKIDEEKNNASSAELIKPGEKYTYFGSLSLHMRVYVEDDLGRKDNRACFTGPVMNFEYVYPISKYFKKLTAKSD